MHVVQCMSVFNLRMNMLVYGAYACIFYAWINTSIYLSVWDEWTYAVCPKTLYTFYMVVTHI
jgi:hypothetical protein